MNKKVELTMKNGMIEQAVEGWTQDALKSIWGALSEISIYPDGWKAKSERRALRNRGAKVVSREGSEIVEAHFKEVTFVYKSCIRRDREADEAAKVAVDQFLAVAISATPEQFAAALVENFRREELFVKLVEAAEARCFKVVCKFERGEFCFGNPQKNGFAGRRAPMEIKVGRTFEEVFAA